MVKNPPWPLPVCLRQHVRDGQKAVGDNSTGVRKSKKITQFVILSDSEESDADALPVCKSDLHTPDPFAIAQDDALYN